MALTYYQIQLNSTSENDGPDYAVYYSNNCVDYLFAGRVSLPTTESIAYAQVQDWTNCIKLESVGNCTNYVVSGSSPSTSSYNTQLVTLTQKNGAGPEFIVNETTQSLFTYLDTVELASEGATAAIEPADNAIAIRLRSTGICSTTETVQIGDFVPTPTPSVPTPTPTPSPTPSPTPVACPTCRAYTVDKRGDPNPVIEYEDCHTGTTRQLTLSSLVDRKIVSRTTPVQISGGQCVITDDGVVANTNYCKYDCDKYETWQITAQAGAVFVRAEYLETGSCGVQTTNIQYSTSATINALSGSLILPAGVQSTTLLGSGTLTTTCCTPPTPTPTPSPSPTPAPGVYYARFITCDDPAGAVIDVYNEYPIPSSSLVLYDGSDCYEWYSVGGTGVDGNTNTFTQYEDCLTCQYFPPPTATPAPTPTPAPSCYTFYTIYGSTQSATDACCNQYSTRPVYLDQASLATATAVYTDNTCSTLRSTPTYYTQNLNDYYYWTGASLIGPTSCPGCP